MILLAWMIMMMVAFPTVFQAMAEESSSHSEPSDSSSHHQETTSQESSGAPVPQNMVFVKGGCFEMGDIFDRGDFDEKPVHTVCLADFYLGKFEITNAEFDMFVKETNYVTSAEKEGTGWGVSKRGATDWELRQGINWRHPLWPEDDIREKMDHPVVQVSWEDAQEYVSWLSEKTGKTYRLPTEAEWEYAARSRGKKYLYSWGEGDPMGNIADEAAKKVFPGWYVMDRFDDGYVFTAPVGKYRPNEIGLYDMSGNVWEWVQDWYDMEYYVRSSKYNPKGPSRGDQRALRGGAWISGPDEARTTLRFWMEPDKRQDIIGFRVAIPTK